MQSRPKKKIIINVKLVIALLTAVLLSLMYYSARRAPSEVVTLNATGGTQASEGGVGGGNSIGHMRALESNSNQTSVDRNVIETIRIGDNDSATSTEKAPPSNDNEHESRDDPKSESKSKSKSKSESESQVEKTPKQFTNPNIGKHEHAYYYYYYYDEDGKAFAVKGKRVEAWTRRRTGAFANCTANDPTSTKPSHSKPRSLHPESDVAVISCREIHYRAPLAEIEQGGVPIVIGVLSGAGGKGPIHRDSIRSTWARDRRGVYFLVAGPWEAIQEEYQAYRDLIWIDEEEVYEGEKSVLPFKTESFMYVIYKHSLPGDAGFHYVFKTDDDSYVDMVKLEELLIGHEKMGFDQWDYWGCCTTRQFSPLRDTSLKWHVTKAMYPEEMYPLYCQGAGFALSRQFVKCSIDEDHMKNFRYNPFEDVSIGLLAERCKIIPISDPDLIRQYRSDEGLSKMLASDAADQIKLPPKATMLDKVLQHRVKTHFDMYAHHICATVGC